MRDFVEIKTWCGTKTIPKDDIKSVWKTPKGAAEISYYTVRAGIRDRDLHLGPYEEVATQMINRENKS